MSAGESGGRFGGRRGVGGPFGRHRGGPFGGRGPRMFDPGALRLVVLGLIAEEPRHGYDIIKALEAKFQGAYRRGQFTSEQSRKVREILRKARREVEDL